MKHLQSNEVQGLRRILRDQYSFHTIVKELVQNADDSKAERFHIGWTDNWPLNTHPLLTGPTVLVLNDGVFRAADAEAIWRVNEGAKGEDLGTIGKYGLGMKSVFHLCEGFFYLPSPDQPAAKDQTFPELLTPWPPGGPHDDWIDLGAASEELRKRIASWPHECSRWFCIAVPLRTLAHLNGADAIIQGQFPTKDEFLQSYDLRELASLMPMLRHVREITTWTWNSDAADFVKQATLTNDSSCCAPCAFPNLTPGKPKVLRTRVLANHDNSNPVLLASGRELLLDDDVFARHHKDGRWPKNFTWNPRTGRSEDAVEKAEPHCAAVFTSSLAEKGSLNIRWAVFLPLSTDIFPKISCDGRLHFELVLHGQFFLDAGRRELYKGDGDEDSLQETWNHDLLNRGVLPLVLPALDEFAGTEDLPLEAVANLTQALHESVLFSDHRQRICCTHNWLRRVTLSGGECARWQLVDAVVPYLTIPQCDTKQDVAIETFPALPDICTQLLVAESESPRLTGKPPSSWSTHPDELNRLFSSIPVTALTGSNTLTYLTEFLRLQSEPLPDEARQILVSRAAEAVADKGIQMFRDLDGLFRDFVRALDPSAWVRIGPIEKEAAALYRDLNSLGLHHVVLPRELTPKGIDGGSLSLDELGTIFTWLADSSSKRPLSRTSTLALRVIEVSTDSIDAKLDAIGEYPVFLVRDGNDNSPERLVSLNDLHEMLASNRIFAAGNKFLGALQRSLCDTLVYSLAVPKDPQPFQTLFGLSEPRNCNVDTCVQLLARHKPRLDVPARRVDLLEHLAPKSADDRSLERRRAIRYLLHGNPNHAGDLDTKLLTRSNLEHAGAIAKLAQLALERQDSVWRWIPDTLFRRLNVDQQNALGLSPVEADAGETLLRELGTDWLCDEDFTAEESAVLLQEIQDLVMWRKLPFHQTVDGRHMSIDASCVYMQAIDDSPFPPELSHAVTVLERPQRDSLLEKYHHNGVLPWTDASTIDVALAQAQPGDYSETILDAISRLCKQEGKIPRCSTQITVLLWGRSYPRPRRGRACVGGRARVFEVRAGRVG